MKKDIKNIILKSLITEITDSQRQDLNQWLDEDISHRDLYAKLQLNNRLTPIDEAINSIDTQKALQNNKRMIVERGDYSITKSKSRSNKRLLTLSISCAASLLILFVVLYNMTPNGEETIKVANTTKENGSATITLATGETISLDNDSKVSKKVGLSEIMVSNNKIAIKGHKLNSSKKIENNSLKVPHGKNYNITLSDGTKVWINALSELKFPMEFGDTRIVELSGEAFFEVTKDSKRPFIVRMKDYDIVVKGTTFNVSNYSDEDISRTTLCSGEVEISLTGDSGHKFTLVPGKQILINHKSKNVTIENVNTKIYTAWREGYYYFEEQTLEDIFKNLSKWYHIESIDFESDNLKSKLYNGKLLKKDDFAKVLSIIEGGTDCIIIRDGAKLLVTKKRGGK